MTPPPKELSREKSSHIKNDEADLRSSVTDSASGGSSLAAEPEVQRENLQPAAGSELTLG